MVNENQIKFTEIYSKEGLRIWKDDAVALLEVWEAEETTKEALYEYCWN